MRIAYFDCIGGISGDMILAACLDAGASQARVKKSLRALGLKDVVKARRLERGHIHALKCDVACEEYRRPAMSLNQITRLIKKSRLDPRVRELSLKIYNTLASAEKKIHRERGKDFQFEQLGEVDSLVDIVGSAAALIELKIDSVYVSKIPLGRAIGPATLELIKDFPVYFTSFTFENVTPTGAAILSALAAKPVVDATEAILIKKIGYGAGSHNPQDVSNVLRIIIAEAQTIQSDETVTVVETNIDDMNPQDFEYVQELLFAAGALDVFYQPVQMKKSRIGILLTVLLKDEALRKITDIIFRETTTLGIRYHTANRKIARRIVKQVATRFGSVRVKLGSVNGSMTTISPEYEDCRRVAQKTQQPLRKIYDEARLEGLKRWR